MQKTLVLVDDHRMLLKGVKDYLEENTDWKVLAACSCAKECLDALKSAAAKKRLPQIAVIDVQLLDQSGIELAKNIASEYPEIRIAMYSMYDTAVYIAQAKAAGVKGYISKVASEEELVRCIETVYSGGEYFEKKAQSSLSKIEKAVPLFTKQEKRVFEMLLQKKSNEEIAAALFVNLHTIENYVSNIYDKLCVKSRAELESKF